MLNQFILGGDPINNYDIDTQLQQMEAYRNKLQQLKTMQNQSPKLIWDEIDYEIKPMTEEQKNILLRDEDYYEAYSRLQNLVQAEILNLVKSRIENNPEGKELLQKQLKIIKKLKGKIIEDTNREMELFKKFKEYSKQNPDVTYEEFIKANM